MKQPKLIKKTKKKHPHKKYTKKKHKKNVRGNRMRKSQIGGGRRGFRSIISKSPLKKKSNQQKEKKQLNT